MTGVRGRFVACVMVLVSFVSGCAEPQAGRAWVFDRDMSVPCEVSLAVTVEHPESQKFQANPVRKTISLDYRLKVERHWQTVNIYKVVDWKTDAIGARTQTVLGEVSDPVGYTTSPTSVVGGPSDIPAVSRRQNNPREKDVLSLDRYPVEVRWRVVAKGDRGKAPIIDPASDGLPEEVMRSDILRHIVISEQSLESMLDSGYEDFTLWIEVRPYKWTDTTSLQLFQKSWRSGSRSYTVHFDRKIILEALGR